MNNTNTDDFNINDVIHRIKLQMSFEEFFIFVTDMLFSANEESYNELFDFVNEFYDVYSEKALNYLREFIIMEKMWYCTPSDSNKLKESDMQKDIINHFNDYFPNYTLIQNEYTLPSIGRIDILAKDNVSDRDVIIELKIGHRNPTQQLISYGSQFDNPILIGITEEPISDKMRHSGITYLVYKDLCSKICKPE